jgi:DNA polymerase-1
MNRLLLLDGNALIHRAYHALPPLTLSSGAPGGAVYGFISMVLRLNTNFHPKYMAVAFDRPGGTFRNELYNAYQSHRPPADEELISQIQVIHSVVNDLGIANFDAQGYEADDVIGTLATCVLTGASAASDIDQVIIVTGDRDILQLVVDEKVLVYMPVKGLSEAVLYGEAQVVKRLGVLPRLVSDWKGLCGDPSDNYPGVAGIGPKGAADLVNQYGSIENIYKAIDDKTIKITERVKSKLISGKIDAFLSKDLATIRTNVPVVFDAKMMKSPDLTSPQVSEVIGALGFPSLVKRAGGKIEVKKEGVKKSEIKKKEVGNKEQIGLF